MLLLKNASFCVARVRQVLPVTRWLAADQPRVPLDHPLGESVGHPGVVRIAQVGCHGPGRRRVVGLEDAGVLHGEERANVGCVDDVGLNASRRGLREHLGRHVGSATTVVLDLDAVLFLEGLDDRIDDLGVEARVEHHVAFRFGLGNIRGRRCPRRRNRGRRGER